MGFAAGEDFEFGSITKPVNFRLSGEIVREDDLEFCIALTIKGFDLLDSGSYPAPVRFGKEWSCEVDFHFSFAKLCKCRFLVACCCRLRSMSCCAFQAGHHFPCQVIILPIMVAGLSLAYRQRRHSSHAPPMNRSTWFIILSYTIREWPN